MFKYKYRVDDYDALKKLRDAKSDLGFEKIGVVDRVVVETLDDVFSKFQSLVNNHPSYSRDVYSNNVLVKDYLDKNFKNSLITAINNNDDRKIHNICSRVAKLYVPKDLGFRKKFFEKKALSYALKSFIKEYELYNSKIN